MRIRIHHHWNADPDPVSHKIMIWTRNPELLKLDLDPFADRISKRKAVLDQAILKNTEPFVTESANQVF